jgi:hypothetical protein
VRHVAFAHPVWWSFLVARDQAHHLKTENVDLPLSLKSNSPVPFTEDWRTRRAGSRRRSFFLSVTPSFAVPAA